MIKKERKTDIHCLTNDNNLPICQKYNRFNFDIGKKEIEMLNKIDDYLINNLACSDKWIAQSVMIENVGYNTHREIYLNKLLNTKLTDITCLGVQELSDKNKQKIQKRAKELAKNTANKKTNTIILRTVH